MAEKPTECESVLMLSIQKQHADRIFAGTKLFELRKQLPRTTFNRVFLYETGGAGVVGYFDVARILRLPTRALWELVGERGTTRERFDAYFAGKSEGAAIEVAAHHRLDKPLSRDDLRQLDSGFVPPQSYLVVSKEGALGKALQRAVENPTHLASDQELFLRDIRADEHALYAAWVQREISRNYDDIDASFAQANLASAERGDDPFALLTRSKRVYSIERIDGVVLGFSTMTFKYGGSVKSGPTILLPEHRRHGYGLRVRGLLETVARSAGARKIYATVPDVSDAVLSYLLRSGMTIEAHLKEQYSKRHGELVLGKILSHAPALRAGMVDKFEARAGQVLHADLLSLAQAARAVSLGLGSYGVRVERARARELVQNMGLEAGYDRKPRDLLALQSGVAIVAGLVLSAKRGGAMRGVLGTSTSHRPSLLRLLEAGEQVVKVSGRRKLYFLHDRHSPLDLDTLRSNGYSIEGMLREPYKRAQDLFVVSKFIT